MMESTTLLALALLGGLVGLDAVSFVQAMISRPIIAGPLAGLILGVPEGGMMVGIVLEIITLRHLPVGAARQWDTGPAAIVAATGVAVLPGGATALMMAIGAGSVVGWLGGRTVHEMRKMNSRLAVTQESVSAWNLTGRQLTAMAGDFARAGLLTLAGVTVVALGAAGLAGAPETAHIVAGVVLVSAVGLMLGADVRIAAGGRRTWAAFGLGAALSAALVLWLS